MSKLPIPAPIVCAVDDSTGAREATAVAALTDMRLLGFQPTLLAPVGHQADRSQLSAKGEAGEPPAALDRSS